MIHALWLSMMVAFFSAASVPAGSVVAERPAPWLAGVRWLNHAPITAADLNGRVVVVEFWTFDCINCRRTIPAMRRLEERFRSDPRVMVLGVHTPELDRERDAANVRRAITALGIRYPIAQDNDFTAWRAFHNQYWPALYVLDPGGTIRHHHVGELHLDTPGWETLLHAIAEAKKKPTRT